MDIKNNIFYDNYIKIDTRIQFKIYHLLLYNLSESAVNKLLLLSKHNYEILIENNEKLYHIQDIYTIIKTNKNNILIYGNIVEYEYIESSEDKNNKEDYKKDMHSGEKIVYEKGKNDFNIEQQNQFNRNKLLMNYSVEDINDYSTICNWVYINFYYQNDSFCKEIIKKYQNHNKLIIKEDYNNLLLIDNIEYISRDLNIYDEDSIDDDYYIYGDFKVYNYITRMNVTISKKQIKEAKRNYIILYINEDKINNEYNK